MGRTGSALRDPRRFKRFAKQRYDLEQKVMAASRVIIVTCSGSMLQKIREFRPDIYIIDEAAYARHYEVMEPLIAHPSICRLILFGDPEQLGPSLISDKAKRSWSVTIMEKLLIAGWPFVLLNTLRL